MDMGGDQPVNRHHNTILSPVPAYFGLPAGALKPHHPLLSILFEVFGISLINKI